MVQSKIDQGTYEQGHLVVGRGCKCMLFFPCAVVIVCCCFSKLLFPHAYLRCQPRAAYSARCTIHAVLDQSTVCPVMMLTNVYMCGGRSMCGVGRTCARVPVCRCVYKHELQNNKFPTQQHTTVVRTNVRFQSCAALCSMHVWASTSPNMLRMPAVMALVMSCTGVEGSMSVEKTTGE